MVRFLLLFSTILVVLFFVELMHLVQAALIVPWTTFLAKISVSVMQVFDSSVRAYGDVIQNIHSGVGVQIEPGCNGVEACIVLVAAILAFPARWRHKFFGIWLGVLAVQVVNVLRVVSLYYLLQWNQPVFEFVHLYMWQALIMLDVLVVWLAWVRFVGQHLPHPVELTS